MQENNGEQKTRKELHLNFSGGVLYRKYNIYSGQRYSPESSYIYQDDDEIRERMKDIEWEEQYNKKCQKMLDEKNK